MQESTNSKPVVSSSSMSFCPSAVKEEKKKDEQHKLDKREKWVYIQSGCKLLILATHAMLKHVCFFARCSTLALNARRDWLPKSILVTAGGLSLVLQVMCMLQMVVELVLCKCQWCIQGSCNITGRSGQFKRSAYLERSNGTAHPWNCKLKKQGHG